MNVAFTYLLYVEKSFRVEIWFIFLTSTHEARSLPRKWTVEMVRVLRGRGRKWGAEAKEWKREREEGSTEFLFFNSSSETLRAKLFTNEQRMPKS